MRAQIALLGGMNGFRLFFRLDVVTPCRSADNGLNYTFSILAQKVGGAVCPGECNITTAI